jgi:hypothetical protein
MQTAFIGARTVFFPSIAAKRVHIRSRAAHILHDALEIRHLRHSFHFPQYRIDTAARYDPSLVMSEGAERT